MRLLTCALVLISIVTGCGSGTDGGQISFSEATVENGLKAFEQRDWQKAELELSTAIGNGGLQPDIAEAAIRSLAVSRVHLGKLAEAEADLQTLKQGAMEMDLFWLASAELAVKKGDSAAAKKAIAEARELNRSVKLSEELQKVR
jgi:hypothetical protein